MPNTSLTALLGQPPWLIGMIHLPALPGSPGYVGDMAAIMGAAELDAKVLESAGYSALLIENLGDTPYFPDRVPPETVAALSVVAARVRGATRLPVGVNVLRNDGHAALAIAAAAKLSFVRLNVLTGAMVTDQGLIQGRAHQLLRLRHNLQADNVMIFADLRVKHAEPLVARDLEQEVEEYFDRAGADAIIVSGHGSGKPVDQNFLRQVRTAAGSRPILIGSGLNNENAAALFTLADGAIVGSSIKVDGKIHNRVDAERAKLLVESLS